MTVEKSESQSEKNSRLLTEFTDWMKREKTYLYSDNRLQEFYSRLSTLLMEIHPEKTAMISETVKVILSDTGNEAHDLLNAKNKSQMVQDVVLLLAGLYKDKNAGIEMSESSTEDDLFMQQLSPMEQHFYAVLKQDWQYSAPVTQIMHKMVEQGGDRPFVVSFAFADTSFSSQEQTFIKTMMIRLGFHYQQADSGEQPHFLIKQSQEVVSETKIPVLQLPLGRLLSSEGLYNQDWLIAVLHTIGKFVGMPVLDENSPAGRISSMAASAARQKRMLAIYPELVGLLKGELTLSDDETAQYLAERLIRDRDVAIIKQRLGFISPQLDEAWTLTKEEWESIQEQHLNFLEEEKKAALPENYTAERFQEYLESLPHWGHMDEVDSAPDPSSEELSKYDQGIQEKLNEPDIALFLSYAKNKVGENYEKSLRQQLIKYTVVCERERDRNQAYTDLRALVAEAAQQFVMSENFDALLDAPRIHYGEFSSIPRSLPEFANISGSLNSYPGYSHADGRIRVYTYAFSGQQDTAEEYSGGSIRLISMTIEQKEAVTAGLAEIAQLAAVRFRQAEEGEQADIDFAVYRESDVVYPHGKNASNSGGPAAFTSGYLPQKRIRFSEIKTFGEDESFIQGTIRHEMLHVLGLYHPDHVFSEDLPSSVMVETYALRVNSIQPFDKLMLQLIHGPNPDNDQSDKQYREAQKIWKARDAWVTDIPLNTDWCEPYIVSGMPENSLSAIEFNAKNLSQDIHSGLSILQLDERTWALHFQDGKEVLVTGMNGKPLPASALNVIVWYDENTAYRLHPPVVGANGQLSALQWTGFSWQNEHWVEISAYITPQGEESADSAVSGTADPLEDNQDEETLSTHPVTQEEALPIQQTPEPSVSDIVNDWENDDHWKSFAGPIIEQEIPILATVVALLSEAMASSLNKEGMTGVSSDPLLHRYDAAGYSSVFMPEKTLSL